MSLSRLLLLPALLSAFVVSPRLSSALEIPPLVVGGGGGIATVYLDHSLGQVNAPLLQLEGDVGPPEFTLSARAGGSVGGGGDKALGPGSALTIQFDYFYSLMLRSGVTLYDPANLLFFQGGWSKFRLRSTRGGIDTLSNKAGFGFGVGLRRDLGGGFGVRAEYMRYTAGIRAGSLSLDYTP